MARCATAALCLLALSVPRARGDGEGIAATDGTATDTNQPAADTNLVTALPADEADAEAPKRRLVSWTQFEGPWFSMRVSGMAMGDASGYSQNAASVGQVGNLDPGTQLRSFRLSANGLFKFDNPWSYIVTAEYRSFDRGSDSSSSEPWQITDLAVTIPLDGIGRLSIGKMKAPFSLERLTGRAVIPFMERAATLDALLPSRDIGLKLNNTAFNDRVTWAAGWFNSWFGGSQSTFKANTVDARVTWIPIYRDDGREVLHLGVSGRYAQAEEDQLRYKVRPEDNLAPYFLDTGNFTADHNSNLGLEAGWQQGPVITTAEYVGDWVSSPQKGDPFFDGFYVTSAWMLTGENRNYNKTGGFWGRVSPDHPLFHGGWGAVEVTGRYSWTDLNGGAISGGKFARWSAGLNWFLTDYTRIEFNYGYGRLDRFGSEGITQFFQGRIQIEF